MLHRMGKITLILVFLLTSVSLADDWPQYRGPNRDGKSAETGLMKLWPAGGPQLLWSVTEDLGKGYSSPAIADAREYGLRAGRLASRPLGGPTELARQCRG